MIQIKFKNLEKSEMAREAVLDRMESLVIKFPDLSTSNLQVTLEMENSPTQAGPDLFKVKLHVLKGRYNGVTVIKGNSNLYIALADVVDHMLEKLNRYGDKVRVKERKRARQLSKLTPRDDEINFRKSEQKIG
jgi:ribosome-associated translation inhibitor RaiA